MVKKYIDKSQKQSVKQTVNVKVHVGDQKKKRKRRPYKKRQSGGGGGSSNTYSSGYNPIFIQSGLAPHLQPPSDTKQVTNTIMDNIDSFVTAKSRLMEESGRYFHTPSVSFRDSSPITNNQSTHQLNNDITPLSDNYRSRNSSRNATRIFNSPSINSSLNINNNDTDDFVTASNSPNSNNNSLDSSDSDSFTYFQRPTQRNSPPVLRARVPPTPNNERQKILNPITKRMVFVDSKLGKSIMNKTSPKPHWK